MYKKVECYERTEKHMRNDSRHRMKIKFRGEVKNT